MALRYPVSLLLGLTVSLLLLWLMQALVTGNPGGLAVDDPLPIMEFVRLRHEPETRVKERTPPKPPPRPKALPKPRLDISQMAKPDLPALDLAPRVAPSLKLQGRPVAGPMLSGDPDRDFVPVSRTPPQYPYQAARRRLEGWVRVAFTITATGTVEDVVLLDSEPAGVFDRAATRAVYKWKFKPRVVDGKPVSARAEQRVEFTLER